MNPAKLPPFGRDGVGINIITMKAFFTALGNLFSKPVTVKYPFVPTYKPDDFRGVIVHNPDLCNWCRRCEMACPPGAIIFSQEMDGKQAYHYSRHVCIYCGECVRTCPKDGSLIQTAEPGKPAIKEDDINNKWTATVDQALKSRAAYMAEKKRQAAAKDKEAGEEKKE
jgi:ech hydrogenase subunit F